MNFDFHPFGKRIDAGDTHAVQSAGDLICVVVKFAACVKNGHYDFDRRFSLFVHVNGNTASIVGNPDAVVGLNGDFHMAGKSCKRFVDTVIDRFIDQMMQTPFSGVADVHTRAFPHCFQTFEHRDLGGGILTVRRCVFFGHYKLLIPIDGPDAGSVPATMFLFFNMFNITQQYTIKESIFKARKRF